MSSRSTELLEQSILSLRNLADGFLSEAPAPVRRISKELRLSISVLLPKLEAARDQMSHMRPPGCDRCDD
jgi:hypothetical protein